MSVKRYLVKIPPSLVGNVIELRESVFLSETKPEGLTEDKDLIIFLALKGRHIILIQ